MRLNFYTVNSQYFNYLREVENRIPYVKENRPFLGIIVKINYKNFFAPMCSPKEKHKGMHEQRDFIKMEEGNLGVINLNNMVPIPMSKCTRLDIANIQDNKYKILLQKQLIWCNKHSKQIIDKAQKLYNTVTYSENENSILKNRCCNFKLLERKLIDYLKTDSVYEEVYSYKVS